ncbi:hypothetical protein NM688_g5860 [Phlebia brevispora]|uniref:Uncharacterized protein n=1 Tax=Phlebia brevispora TaxID=194682 RepID=A0ACC1SNM3_9APHY|nr:hypothetical protein NM688_g5860 [Phlebia brevispora]
MSSEVLSEEFEVLESIFPEELSKLSETEIRIEVEPEEITEGCDPLKLGLDVTYPDDYPNALPQLSLDAIEGDLEEEESEQLLRELQTAGEENLGMAMTFTLVSLLREKLSDLVRSRVERRKAEETEKERLALEAEAARTRGTPVTAESFNAWKVKFAKEMAIIQAREDEEKMKNMSAKEREEYKRLATRLSGRQLFERDKNLDVADASLLEEGAVSIDPSQYERETVEEEEEDGLQVTFSDSDSE